MGFGVLVCGSRSIRRGGLQRNGQSGYDLSLTTNMTYSIGDNVKRLEDRPQVDAGVLTVEDGWNGQMLELAYVEGGTGWWPADAVVPADA